MRGRRLRCWQPGARGARRSAARRPRAQLVIAADDDCETDGNPGLTAARKAANAVGATVAVPAREQPDGRKLDFNDLAVAEGNEAVAAHHPGGVPPEPEPEPEPDAAQAEPEPAAEPEDDWQQRLAEAIAELNERYFVAAMGGSVRIASLAYDDALGRERLVFMREADMRLLYSHRHYKVGETQRRQEIVKGLGDAWLNHCQRRTYRADRVDPQTAHARQTSSTCGADGACSPRPARGPRSRHIYAKVVCSGRKSTIDWLIGWLAYCVQHPGRQAEVAVVLRGLKGTGKGMVGADADADVPGP